MDADLKAMIERLVTELGPWLERPTETSKKIAKLREEMGDLSSDVKAAAIKTAIKALDEAEAEAGRLRKREAAEAIAELCRPLGVRLEARDAPKRSGRKAGSGSGRPKPSQN